MRLLRRQYAGPHTIILPVITPGRIVWESDPSLLPFLLPCYSQDFDTVCLSLPWSKSRYKKGGDCKGQRIPGPHYGTGESFYWY